MPDVAVIGAGVAGLACARALAESGRSVVVFDKARGVGGRCATRRITWGGHTVRLDHGLAFYPANDPDFRAALSAVPGGVVDGWPRRILGDGPPCQPEPAKPVFHRLALRDGASALPKHLAAGLDVRLGARATAFHSGEITFEDGEPVAASRIVVALPVEQAAALAAQFPAAGAVLGFFASRSCLAIAGLWAAERDLGFDLARPGGAVAHIADETTKGRQTPAGTRALVIHASSRFSAAHLEEAPEVWGPSLLGACAAFTGEWIREPLIAEYHRWRYARIDAGFGLSAPLVVESGEGIVGWCGEAFDPAGGVAGAWRSGLALARLLS